jgi:CheY-like chemotaxis protein
LDQDVVDGLGGNRWYLQLTVADTGVGIEETMLERIFDPYFTTKRKGKGTGMGLSVVHGIVKNCEGDIRVESAVGKGTVIRVYLPAHTVLTQKPDETAVNKTSFGNQETILVVDDEPQIAHVLQLMLESIGYRVVAHTSSRAALQVFEASPGDFDMVITDMTMPELTGEELARAIRQIEPDIPVIMCTGFNENMNEDRARQLGIRRLVYKPIVRSTLAEIVRNALHS